MFTLKGLSAFVVFMVYYLLLLIIPLTACLYIYSSAADIIQDKVYTSHMSALRQNIETIDREFKTVEDIAYNLQVNLEVNQYIQSENPYDDQDKLANFTKVMSYLSPYVLVNDFLGKILIYSEKSNSVITDKIVSIRLDRLYPKAFQVDDLDLQGFVGSFLRKEYRNAYLYGVDVKEITGQGTYLVYAQSLTNAVSHRANVFLFVDQEKILDYLDYSILDGTTDSLLYFRTADGYIAGGGTADQGALFGLIDAQFEASPGADHGFLIESLRADSGKKQAMFIMYVRSARNGFTYLCAIPMVGIVNEISRTRNFLILMLAATFVVSLLTAAFLAYRQSDPIRTMVDSISRIINVQNVSYSYDFINRQLSDILSNNANLQKELTDLLPLRKNSIVHSLINGEYRGTEEILRSLALLGIEGTAKQYCVMIILVDEGSDGRSLHESAAHTLLLSKAIEECGLPAIGLLTIDFERQALLIGSELAHRADLVAQLESAARTLSERMSRETGISLSFSASISAGPEKIPDLYREAKVALGYQDRVNDYRVQWYRKGAADCGGRISYTVETEMALIKAVSEGDGVRCADLLKQLQGEVFGSPSPDKNADDALRVLKGLHLTLGRLRDVLPDLSEEISAQDAKTAERLGGLDAASGDAAGGKGDSEGIYLELRDFLETLGGQVRKSAKKKSNPLIQKTLAFLQERFTDPQLSLSSVAREFGITDIYLSKLFKDHTSSNYSTYVETLRMGKAQELLGRNLPISQVALQSGYSSVQTFRRVYKQHFGRTPSEGLPG
jgi:AraC-like DNA-binding protein